jgi:hypothetical protein
MGREFRSSALAILALPALLALAALGACASGGGAGRLEPHTIPAQPLVEERPRAVIGRAGNSAHRPGAPTAAVLLSGGEVVIASSGTNELQWYTLDGEFIRSVGSRSPQPVAFTGKLSLAACAGDSLVVFDDMRPVQSTATGFSSAGGKFSILDREGAVAWSSTSRTAGQERIDPADVMGPRGFPDCTVLALRLPPDPAPRLQTQLIPAVAVRIHLRDNSVLEIGDVGDTPPPVPQKIMVVRAGSQQTPPPPPPPALRTAAMGPGLLAPGDGRIHSVVHRDGVSELRTLDLRGRVIRTVRWSAPKVSVAARASVSSGLHTDGSGRVWVEEMRAPGDDAISHWIAIEPDGSLHGRFSLPRGATGATIAWIDDDHVIVRSGAAGADITYSIYRRQKSAT